MIDPPGLIGPRLESKHTEDFLAASPSNPVNLIGIRILRAPIHKDTDR